MLSEIRDLVNGEIFFITRTVKMNKLYHFDDFGGSMVCTVAIGCGGLGYNSR